MQLIIDSRTKCEFSFYIRYTPFSFVWQNSIDLLTLKVLNRSLNFQFCV